jgi:cytochrome d ubiquinol oxidase subunit II
MIDYPLIWGGLIAFAVLAYVLLDGFDLGIGLIYPWLGGEAEQDIAMNSVAPVWDGNETWLVLGGGGLFAVFPLAYAIIMPAMYAPLIAMLLGLILRGVAFEFRWRTSRGKFIWNWAFTIGSLVATLCQGLLLGTLVQGIAVEGRAYAGGWWDWLTPFSLACAVAMVCGYVLLGSTWLVLKTEGELRALVRKIAWHSGFATLAVIGLVSLWTPMLQPEYMERWFGWPVLLYVAPVPLLVLAAAASLFQGLRKEQDTRPFISANALFILCYIGLGISFYPNIVPPSISIWEAAGPDSSLKFLLVGAVVLIPLILAYTVHAYWVFRGKIDSAVGYH